MVDEEDPQPRRADPGKKETRLNAEASRAAPRVISGYRISASLPPEVDDALRNYAARHGITLSEAVRRAISVLVFLDDVVEGDGKILVAKEGEPVREIEIIP